MGETVTVEAFEVGQKVKISGKSKGKGFAGTIKRHNFSSGPKSHGSHNVRAPGSIGASATPSRVFKGIRGPGRMGGGRVTQRGLTIVEIMPNRNLLLVRGAVPGPNRLHRGGAHRCLGPLPSSAAARPRWTPTAFEASFNMRAGPRGRARRAQRAPAGHPRHQDARRGVGRRRQAVAPEGHRPRPRRVLALADMDRRRHRLRPPAAPLHRQGQPQGAPCRAARARCRCTPSASRWPCSTPTAFDAPSTKQAVELLDGWLSTDQTRLDPGPPLRGRGQRRAVVPQPAHAST